MSKERNHIRDERAALLGGIGVPEKTTFVPDAFQLEAIDALHRGEDTLVIAPTGAGKTYIATEGISQIIKDGKRAVYTAPLKALSNSKYNEFKKRFEPEYRVGLLTGDRKIEGDASVVVATTEIYRNELYSAQENYALVVLDELHYLADPQRGPVWEESIILSPRSATLLMLSASISNAQETAEWIEEVRGRKVKIITVKVRPVSLRLAFLHPEYGVIPLEDKNGDISPEVQRYYSDGSGGDYRGGRGGRGGGRRFPQGGGRGRRRR